MTKQEAQKLLDFLKEKNLLTDEQYKELTTSEYATFDELEKQARRAILISDEDWVQAKGVFYDLEYVNLVGRKIDSEVLNILPEDLSENYKMVVFNKEGANIEAGLVDPTNFKAIEALNYLARKKKFKVKYHIISEDSYRAAAKQYETLGEEVGEALDTAEAIFAPKEEEIDLDGDVSDVVKSAPVSKIVSVVLRHAIEGRASDIHIEPVSNQSKVRYRIDGVLHTTIVLPIYVHSALVSRIKVMANLKIDETRIPQDGRIRMKVHNKDIDFRISTIPLMGQEKVVMRILATPDKAPSFSDLGFLGLQLKVIEKNVHKPNGMFLLTGPTGSGKSTTLFAFLSFLNQEDVNIATLEDPVEYYIPGVNQSQIRPEVNFTFASGLRALLRQDPDIIMVGEIRDNETAELAIHAGLTGHSVLTTLHTNSAIGAIPRLFDMKVEPFLLASTLNAVVAQRLVRKICLKCKAEDKLPPDVEKNLKEHLSTIPDEAFYGEVDKNSFTFYKGKGCANCGQTGYKGRLSIAEAIHVTRGFKDIIAKGFDRAEVDKELAKQNFITMEQDGVIKVLLGMTTVEEIMRVSKM
ncbi:MAG: type II/IV secretion system protein [Candidatus Komeilibacteria bacterium]|jgi:type IV pilus assembly protein PilB|nr:type II/IV secretion system protein [Candidatus Komeilibacteria bacterium]MBT4447949.1 type II/IV secretion system protein [Candidatus Komeilibacteria bacterium]